MNSSSQETDKDLLYISHCVPFPPDKGERIRAYNEVRLLAQRYRVHVVCAARNRQEREAARGLEAFCASVQAVPIDRRRSLALALLRFASGSCLNTAYHSQRALRDTVRETAESIRPFACVVYTAAVFPCAPPRIPIVLDMVDVDSEKWLEYSRRRRPSSFYKLEARRLRREETEMGARSKLVCFTTEEEVRLYRSFAAGVHTAAMENGVDADFFDPEHVPDAPELAGRRFVVFVGYLDYYPNRDAVISFADQALPVLRRSAPELQFVVVGRNAPREIRALGRRPEIQVTGGVPDIRPFLKHAAAVVAPLRIARGIQNKVLEGLAMGRPVLASDAVSATFGPRQPEGLISCATPEEYPAALEEAGKLSAQSIRNSARRRFDWNTNLATLVNTLEELEALR